MVYNFSASIMRAVGETKKPLRYLIVAGILNVVINVVTVVFFKWHVVGVALGTTVSQYVSALWITVDLSRSKDGSRLSLKKVRLHEKEFVKILRIGVPMGLTSCAFSLSNLFVQSAINTFGPLTIAGNTVATNIETVCDSFTAAAKSGVVTSIGQNMGAKKPERIKRIIGAGSLMCVTCQAVYATIMFAFGRQVCGLLNGDPQVVDWALKRAYMVGCLNVIALPLIIHGGALQGMGYSMFPMMVNLFFTCVVRIIYMLLVYPFLAVKTVTAVYILYPISWFGASLLMLFFCMRCVKKELEKKKREEANANA
jgi:Na+-driven multidrug efflux pump